MLVPVIAIESKPLLVRNQDLAVLKEVAEEYLQVVLESVLSLPKIIYTNYVDRKDIVK